METPHRSPAPEASARRSLIPHPDRSWWRTWGPWIGVCLLGLILTALFLPPPVPRVIRLGAGPEGGGYDALATALGDELARDGFQLEVVATKGSVENVRKLRAHEVDVALVQGGTVPPSARELRSVCSVFFEPLWLLVARDLKLNDLRDLRGHRLAVGADGSGTRALALALLRANSLGAEDVSLAPLGGAEAAAALRRGEVDAVFAVVAASAAWLPDIMADERVRLHDWARSETYARRWGYLHALTVTPGLLDLARNLPAQTTRVVAPAAALVFHGATHRGLVPPILEALKRLQRRDSLFATQGTFPSTSYVDAPMDDDAQRYLERGPSFLYRIFPIRVAQVLDRLKIFLIPLLTLLFPIFKLAPPIYRWRMRSRIYRWYRILRDAEALLTSPHSAPRLDEEIRRLDALEGEIWAVEVPLSFADELYDLHLHIDYVRGKLGTPAVAEDDGPAT